jgi:acyl-coenzyme A thioesterase PaaI-like protein
MPDPFIPPSGFAPYTRPSPLLEPWRPLWIRELPDRVVIGLQVREAHCNSRGTVHGGLFAALADQAMGHTSSGHILVGLGWPLEGLWTTSLTLDYLRPAQVGQWLEFDTHFNQGNRTSWHAEIDIRADGETVARGRASFRVKLGDKLRSGADGYVRT